MRLDHLDPLKIVRSGVGGMADEAIQKVVAQAQATWVMKILIWLLIELKWPKRISVEEERDRWYEQLNSGGIEQIRSVV
jgi:hypothetical protein